MINLTDFKKKKDFLICVDSDGCVMDTMDIKHIKCFGPALIKEWHLEKWEEIVLKRWNEVNLYTLTRGINRFKGLIILLKEIDSLYTKIENLSVLESWVENAKELSNSSLKTEIEKNPNEILIKALSWSNLVNTLINLLPEEEKLPFGEAKKSLEYAHKFADVAIVSSANLEAVMEEWEKYGLLDHVDIVLAQNVGSKVFCISELVKKGYDKNNVLMCGDAPGDKGAADKNNVLFYPILVKKENQSWIEFVDEACDKFISKNYSGDFQDKKNAQFYENLSK